MTIQRLIPLFAGVLMLGSALVLRPEEAWAWGPGVHMVISNWALQNLAVLPMEVAGSIMNFPGQFIYGCLSADIFIGKGSKPKQGHSHNWETGFALVRKSHTVRRTAYAWGYVSHLAADTVAHNVYVPCSFQKAPGLGRLAHVYLEMQADRLQRWDSRDALRVFSEKPSKAAERMLRTTMGQSSLSFWLKKNLYLSSIALGGRQTWKHSLALLDSLFPEERRKAELQRLLTISTRAVLDVLAKGRESKVCTLDPIGAEAILQAELQGKKFLPIHPLVSAFQSAYSAENAAKKPQEAITIRLPEVLEKLPSVCTP